MIKTPVEPTDILSSLCSKKYHKEPKGSKLYYVQIQNAQHKAYVKRVSKAGHPKPNVSHLRHPGALRGQPCIWHHFMVIL